MFSSSIKQRHHLLLALKEKCLVEPKSEVRFETWWSTLFGDKRYREVHARFGTGGDVESRPGETACDLVKLKQFRVK